MERDDRRHFLYPSATGRSTYDLPYEMMYDEGVRAILFDIDNTLVPHGAPADDRARALFDRLRETGFKTCLVSNNKEMRVKSFADDVGSSYVYKAGKPGKKGYLRAMELTGTDVSSTVLVGDQIFTDLAGANLLGMRTVLVKPIHPREEIQIVLKRFLEFFVLTAYRLYIKRHKPWFTV